MSHKLRFSTPLLKMAFVSAVLSTLLFVAASPLLGINVYFPFPVQWVYVVAHLLGGFGVGLLLWAIVSEPDEQGKRDWLQCAAVVTLVLYHLVAAVSYGFMFSYGLYKFAMMLWWARMVLILTVVFDFIVFGDELLNIAGVLLLLAMVASCPFTLPGGWSVAQWIVAKITALLLALMLYVNAKSISRY